MKIKKKKKKKMIKYFKTIKRVYSDERLKEIFHNFFFLNYDNNPVIVSFVHVCTCVYIFLVSPVAIFRTGFSLVEYCSGSFRPFLQFHY